MCCSEERSGKNVHIVEILRTKNFGPYIQSVSVEYESLLTSISISVFEIIDPTQLKSQFRGASRGGGGIHPLPSKREVSLKRPFAPKMSNNGLK